jgi:alpha-mannosidase
MAICSVELVDGVGNNKNLGVTDECLLLFGNGDGGGGPTPRMLSKVRFSHSRTTAESSRPSTARAHFGARDRESGGPKR